MGSDSPGNWWSIALGMGGGWHEAWLSFSISVTLLHPSGAKTCHTREQGSHFPPPDCRSAALPCTPQSYHWQAFCLQTLGWQPATLSPPAVFPNLVGADWPCLDKWMTSKARARTKITPSLFPKSPYAWWQDVAANSHQAQKPLGIYVCMSRKLNTLDSSKFAWNSSYALYISEFLHILSEQMTVSRLGSWWAFLHCNSNGQWLVEGKCGHDCSAWH